MVQLLLMRVKVIRVQYGRCHAFFYIIIREPMVDKAFFQLLACFMPMELPAVFLGFFPSIYLIYALNDSFNDTKRIVIIIQFASVKAPFVACRFLKTAVTKSAVDTIRSGFDYYVFEIGLCIGLEGKTFFQFQGACYPTVGIVPINYI